MHFVLWIKRYSVINATKKYCTSDLVFRRLRFLWSWAICRNEVQFDKAFKGICGNYKHGKCEGIPSGWIIQTKKKTKQLK